MDTRRGSTSPSSALLGSTRPVLRIAAMLFVLAGMLSGALHARGANAQPALIGGIEIRVHSCPDDFDGTGFFQHLTQCTSERGLYGVALGVDSPGTGGPLFQYSQPDGTGRADLMRWTEVAVGNVTITEVAPDPITPSVAFCSLQPGGGGPLTMDGDEVPVNDGVLSIQVGIGDTLMCDWYRWPGGATAGDEGDDQGDGGDQGGGNDGGNEGGEAGGDGGAGAVEGVVYDPEGGEGGNPELTGSQILIRTWDCLDGEQIDGRPEILGTDSAQGLAELEDACDPSAAAYQFTLGDVIAAGGDEQPEGAADDEQVAAGDEDGGDVPGFQGIVAEDGTVVDEEGGPDEAVAGGPSGDGGGTVNQGLVGDDDEANDEDAANEANDANDVDEPGNGEGAVGVYPPLEIGGIPQYEGWNGLTAGTYTILASLPEGYDEPLVLCDGVFAGAQPGTRIVELAAVDRAVTYDLSEGEMLLCSWFNIRTDAEDEDDGGEDGQNGGDDTANNDRDQDGLLNTEETDAYNTDPDDEDSDDDGVVDGDEILFGTNPNSPDTDGDTFTDAEEMYELGTDPAVYDLGPLDDNDGDFLTNGDEVHVYGTNPFRSDSDMDGLSDYLEVITYGSDPWVEDTDGDGYKDAVEADAGTDPTVADR